MENDEGLTFEKVGETMQSIIKVPMVAEVLATVQAKFVVKSIVDASVEFIGPLDEDKDGDPEFKLFIDLPGEKWDGEFVVEIPVSLVTKGVPGMVHEALLQITERFPMKKTLTKVFKHMM